MYSSDKHVHVHVIFLSTHDAAFYLNTHLLKRTASMFLGVTDHYRFYSIKNLLIRTSKASEDVSSVNYVIAIL